MHKFVCSQYLLQAEKVCLRYEAEDFGKNTYSGI